LLTKTNSVQSLSKILLSSVKYSLILDGSMKRHQEKTQQVANHRIKWRQIHGKKKVF